MNPEENDALWKLLGTAERKPEISPTFAQNVARQARQIGKPKGGFWRDLIAPSGGSVWNGARSAAVACAVAAAVITTLFLFEWSAVNSGNDSGFAESDPPIVPEVAPSADPVLEGFENEMVRIDHFDALLTVGDVGDLEDEEIAMLLF